MICHYLLHKVNRFPSDFLSLDRKEKAFVTASVLIKMEQAKEQAKEAERMKNAPKRKR